MSNHTKIVELLKQCQGDTAKEAKAARLVHWYHAECLNAMSQRMTPEGLNATIEKRREELMYHLMNVVEPFIENYPFPALADAVQLLSDAQVSDYFTLRLMVAIFLRQWDTAGLAGFACRDNTALHALLGVITQMRELVLAEDVLCSMFLPPYSPAT